MGRFFTGGVFILCRNEDVAFASNRKMIKYCKNSKGEGWRMKGIVILGKERGT